MPDLVCFPQQFYLLLIGLDAGRVFSRIRHYFRVGDQYPKECAYRSSIISINASLTILGLSFIRNLAGDGAWRIPQRTRLRFSIPGCR